MDITRIMQTKRKDFFLLVVDMVMIIINFGELLNKGDNNQHRILFQSTVLSTNFLK